MPGPGDWGIVLERRKRAMFQEGLFKGKKILVTGGGTGLGGEWPNDCSASAPKSRSAAGAEASARRPPRSELRRRHPRRGGGMNSLLWYQVPLHHQILTGQRLAQRLAHLLRRELGGQGGQSTCAVIVMADRPGGGQRLAHLLRREMGAQQISRRFRMPRRAASPGSPFARRYWRRRARPI